jgi:hypothetical protein
VVVQVQGDVMVVGRKGAIMGRSENDLLPQGVYFNFKPRKQIVTNEPVDLEVTVKKFLP